MSILKILKVEGLPYSNSDLGCYVHLNNILQDILTPITPDHSIPVPNEGEIKLLLKTITEEKLLASCTLQLETLTPTSFSVPLHSEPSIPTGSLHLTLSTQDASCELSPESENQISDEEIDCPRLRLQLKMQTFSLQEINLELQSTKQKLSTELKAKQTLETKFQETVKDYSQFVNMAQGREKSMLKLLEQKDIEIAENINQTLKLQGYLDRLLEDKRHVEEKLACLKTVTENDETELLRQQVQQLKTQLVQEDKRRQELQEMLLQIGKEWRETEDQEKLNSENKLIRLEQEVLRANAAVQDLQMEVRRFQSAQDKSQIEIQILKQELESVSNQKVLNDADLVEVRGKLSEKENKCVEVEDCLSRFRAEMKEVFAEKEKMAVTLVSKDKEIEELQLEVRKLNTICDENRSEFEKIAEKLQQEKIYSDRLNDQIIQERLSAEKCKKDALGPDLDSLIEESFRTAKMENSLLKVGESYFYDGLELQISKKIEFLPEVKIANSKDGPVSLVQFLTTPKPVMRKKSSQDCRVESENEAASVFSVDRDKSMFNMDKVEKREIKGKGKLISKPVMKLPLKDKNFRMGSASVERKRPFK